MPRENVTISRRTFEETAKDGYAECTKAKTFVWMSKQGRFCLFFEEEEHVSAYAWNKVPLSPSPVCAFPHE